jgi:hypothetical protein
VVGTSIGDWQKRQGVVIDYEQSRWSFRTDQEFPNNLVEVFGVEGSGVEAWVEDLVLGLGDGVGFLAGEESAELIDEALFCAYPFCGHFSSVRLVSEPLDLLAHDVIPMACTADYFAGDFGSIGGADDAAGFFAGAEFAGGGDGFTATGAFVGLGIDHSGSSFWVMILGLAGSLMGEGGSGECWAHFWRREWRNFGLVE